MYIRKVCGREHTSLVEKYISHPDGAHMVRILHGPFQLRVITNAGEKKQCFNGCTSAL
jgi:hypothetical protein